MRRGKREKATCVICSGEFMALSNLVKRGWGAETCSKKCGYLLASRVKQNKKPEVVCSGCGITFKIKKSLLSKKNWFCKSDCYRKNRAVLRASDNDIFLSRIDKNGPVVRSELGNCWIWTGGHNESGYGMFRTKSGKHERAHRYQWYISHGKAPSLHVLHKCDNPPCVRPDHLLEGNDLDNVTDCISKGRFISRDGKPLIRQG